MTASLTILRPGDSPQLAALQRASTGQARPAKAWEDALRDPTRLTLAICGPQGALAAAISAAMAPDLADIHDVFVDPGRRRRGYGRDLVLAIAGHANARGIARIGLDVSEANRPARALYEKLGFQVDRVRQGYYRDGSSALVMSRPIYSLAGLKQRTEPSCDHEQN
ncbi:MAG: GNAT family N-acetyltransferase [Pseudomonadota bacterium]